MRTAIKQTSCAALAAVALLFSAVGRAEAGMELITNGGFETGGNLNGSGWTQANAGNGSWFEAAGTVSPISAHQTAGPASGSFYAISDQSGQGAHALLQSFAVDPGSQVTLSFDMFVNDWDGGPFAPGGPNDLNYTITPNEHARVDILTGSASVFDTSSGVLDNLYNGADPINGIRHSYTHYSFDLTNLVGGGGTFQIRFAEADNQSYLNMGVDNVSILETAPAPPVSAPAPSGLILLGVGSAGLMGYAGLRRKRAAKVVPAA